MCVGWWVFSCPLGAELALENRKSIPATSGNSLINTRTATLHQIIKTSHTVVTFSFALLGLSIGLLLLLCYIAFLFPVFSCHMLQKDVSPRDGC